MSTDSATEPVVFSNPDLDAECDEALCRELDAEAERSEAAAGSSEEKAVSRIFTSPLPLSRLRR